MSVHQQTFRVYYESTDFSGRVYHAEYLKFMERARTDFLFHHGIRHQDLLQENLFFVVHHMEIFFRGSATIGDEIVAKTQLTHMSPVSLTMEQNLFCDQRLIVQATVKIALIKGSGRPVRLPPLLKNALFPLGDLH